MLHGLIAYPFAVGGSTPLITVIIGLAFLTTSVASKFLLGKTCRFSLIFSLAVLAVAARLITVALLVLIVSWINVVVGKCICICHKRPGVLVFA